MSHKDCENQNCVDRKVKIAVMQPYFFPYIGYWQLMNYVDCYVIFDDVNYINRGWINRNRILINGEIKYINLPIVDKSQNKLINELHVSEDIDLKRKLLKKIEFAYKKTSNFKTIFPMIEKIIMYKELSLPLFIKNSFEIINNYLNINTMLVLSSNINKNNNLKGKDKILSICKQLNASQYVNAIGGQHLYSKEEFKNSKIDLRFIQTLDVYYNQSGSCNFIPDLSIIDMLFNCSKEEVIEKLNEFKLI